MSAYIVGGVFVVVGAALAFVGARYVNDAKVDGWAVVYLLGVAMVIAGLGVILGWCIE